MINESVLPGYPQKYPSKNKGPPVTTNQDLAHNKEAKLYAAKL